MANQYGINLANVLNTKDQIAMNKLKREGIQKQNEIQEAGEENMYARLKSENPDMPEEQLKNMSLNTELYEYDRARKDKAADRAASFSNSVALQNRSLANSKALADYKSSLKSEAVSVERARRAKIIKAHNPDMSDDLVEAYAGEQVKDISKVLDTIYDLKTPGQVDGVIGSIKKDGAMLHTISVMEDPAQQEAAWTDYRNAKLKSIENPEALQAAMKKLPEKFDPNWTALTITSSVDMLKSAKQAKEYLHKTEAQIKSEQGEGIGSPTYAQQTAKVNAISKKVDSYFENLDDPKMAQSIKAKVVKKWEQGGRKQNEDEIILEAIEEMEQNELANTPEEKSFLQGLKEKIGVGSKEQKIPQTKAPKKDKNAKIVGDATKPEGTQGKWKGKNIEVIGGKWVIVD